LQQPQHRWPTQVITGQRQRRRIGGLQIRAQSVEQSALITRGAAWWSNASRQQIRASTA
jgi:hypothetical protein